MNPLVNATGIQLAYGQRPVLRGIDLILQAGEVVALLGPNGAGKTTLIKVLLGQVRCQGSVAWSGRPVAAWKRRELSRLVAYLPQNPAFEPGQSIADALRLGRAPYWGAFGLETQSDVDAVQHIAKLLELNDFLHRRLDQVSGGQRQRVFLGRCLVQEPRALLLDEPSTFLDLRHQVDLLRLLKRLAHDQGLAVLTASHELSLAAAFSDRLILLEDGRVAADGPPDTVLREDLLSRVFGLPLHRIDIHGRTPILVPKEI